MSAPQLTSSEAEVHQNRGVDELPQQYPGRHLMDQSVAPGGLLVEKARGPLPSGRHIRLLQISSSTIEQGALRLEFIEVRLDEAPAYKALSYTWGPPSTASCLENPQGYRLTPNLTACLSELIVRLPGLWWIDALCINQDDPVEKSHQVTMMRTIYASAQQLYVWLGPDADDVQSAVELLHELDRIKSEGIIVPGDLDTDFCDKDLVKIGLPGTDGSPWRALVSLTNRTYFERMWVVQELAAAPQDIAVLCGDIVFPWWVLNFSLRLLQDQKWEYPLLDLFVDVGASGLVASVSHCHTSLPAASAASWSHDQTVSLNVERSTDANATGETKSISSSSFAWTRSVLEPLVHFPLNWFEGTA